MQDRYEPSEDHPPWRVRRPDWPDPGGLQNQPARSDQPGVPPADTRPHRLDVPAGWMAEDPYLGHSYGNAPHSPLGRRPADWPAYDPYQRQPSLPSQPPYPPPPGSWWRQGWADYDPYPGHPVWPGYPGYVTRTAGLRRLSKLTWRAAEVSAVVAVSFGALFARSALGASSHAAAKPSVTPSIHAAATHHAHKRHKRHHHHHHAGPSAPVLAPPSAPPAAPAAPPPAAVPPPAPPPPPPPPPPPVTTSGGSGGG
jgi:hypothetical protein